MDEVKRILSERESEINYYFEHLKSIEDTSEEPLFKILKANMLLMLYNVVEATISNAINTIRTKIHEDIDSNFNILKQEIKVQIIKDLKKNISPENFTQKCIEISKDIIKLSFNKEEISKGNINLDALTDLSKVYGFNIKNSDYLETGHGNTLDSIKEKRNDLSHGIFSFAEVGKDFSVQDIERYKNQTIRYLSFVVSNIEQYLNQREYRAIAHA